MFYHYDSCLCLHISNGSNAPNKVAVRVLRGGGPGINTDDDAMGSQEVSLPRPDPNLWDSGVVRENKDPLRLPS